MKIPTPKTLAKYGLSEQEWIELYNKFDGACHVCHIKPSSDRLYIEHEHFKGWTTMSPEEKKKRVRGLGDYLQ